MKLKLKFKLYYIIQLIYYNSELSDVTLSLVGDTVGEFVLPKTGPVFVCGLPNKSSYVIEVTLVRSKASIWSGKA